MGAETIDALRSMLDALNGCIDALAEAKGMLSEEQLASLSESARWHFEAADCDLGALYRGDDPMARLGDLADCSIAIAKRDRE